MHTTPTRRELLTCTFGLGAATVLAGDTAHQVRRRVQTTHQASGSTRDQVLSCYPQLPEFLDHKRRYDPTERFQSDWYRHYRDMFA